MSNNFLANCRRCDREINEDHSHIMLVTVEGERTFLHAGCELRSLPEPDLVEENKGGDPSQDRDLILVMGGTTPGEVSASGSL